MTTGKIETTQPQIAHCDRCAVRLRVASTSTPEARLLKHATVPRGLCVNCATTEWLLTTHVVGDLLKNPRCRGCGRRPTGGDYERAQGRLCRCAAPDLPTIGETLALPHVQAIFAQILAVGRADARPDEIDWDEVAANWDLPFPKAPRKRKSK